MATEKNKGEGRTENGSMPLTGHLREMRNRIIVCIILFAAGFAVCLACAPRLVTLLTELGTRYKYTFVYIAPQELLMAYFSMALVGGLVVAAPTIAYELYAFCSPGLTRRERLCFSLAMVFGFICFAAGAAFAYFLIMPFMLNFLISFSYEVNVTDSISIGEYLNFLLTVFLIFGVVFELPVVSVVLTRLGLIRAEWLVKARKVMIVVIFFIAAIITPPDVVSQVMVAVPMIGLYEISIWLSKLTRRRDLEGAS